MGPGATPVEHPVGRAAISPAHGGDRNFRRVLVRCFSVAKSPAVAIGAPSLADWAPAAGRRVHVGVGVGVGVGGGVGGGGGSGSGSGSGSGGDRYHRPRRDSRSGKQMTP
jgi:hypothetical protein